jgi:hypothetical protein
MSVKPSSVNILFRSLFKGSEDLQDNEKGIGITMQKEEEEDKKMSIPRFLLVIIIVLFQRRASHTADHIS